MNPRFNPLLKQSDSGTESNKPFKLKVLPSEEIKAPYQSLSSALGSANAGTSRRNVEATNSDHEHEPKIDLKREGETITRITVTCGCGSVMEIDCEYPASS